MCVWKKQRERGGQKKVGGSIEVGASPETTAVDGLAQKQ